jgi:hypothetical protein
MTGMKPGMGLFLQRLVSLLLFVFLRVDLSATLLLHMAFRKRKYTNVYGLSSMPLINVNVTHSRLDFQQTMMSRGDLLVDFMLDLMPALLRVLLPLMVCSSGLKDHQKANVNWHTVAPKHSCVNGMISSG